MQHIRLFRDGWDGGFGGNALCSTCNGAGCAYCNYKGFAAMTSAVNPSTPLPAQKVEDKDDAESDGLGYIRRLLFMVHTEMSLLNELDATGHVYWNRFKEMVEGFLSRRKAADERSATTKSNQGDEADKQIQQKSEGEIEEMAEKIYPLLPKKTIQSDEVYGDYVMEVRMERKAFIAGAKYILNNQK